MSRGRVLQGWQQKASRLVFQKVRQNPTQKSNNNIQFQTTTNQMQNKPEGLQPQSPSFRLPQNTNACTLTVQNQEMLEQRANIFYFNGQSLHGGLSGRQSDGELRGDAGKGLRVDTKGWEGQDCRIFGHWARDSIVGKVVQSAIQVSMEYRKCRELDMLQNHQETTSQTHPNTLDLSEQSLKQQIENPQPNPSIPSLSPSALECNPGLPLLTTLSTENVIEQITGQTFKKLKKLKGYNNRKQLLALEFQLKEKLLEKYGLGDIGSGCEGDKIDLKAKDVVETVKPKFGGLKKNGKGRVDNQNVMMGRLAKKLQRVMVSSQGYERCEARKIIMKILQNIQNETPSTKKPAKLSHLFKAVSKIIKNKQTSNQYQELVPHHEICSII